MKFYSTLLLNEDPTTFDDQTFLHINDPFDNLRLQQLFKNGTPGVVFNDCFTTCEMPMEVKFYGLPLWTLRMLDLWSDKEFDTSPPTTNHCFNFMINKKQLTRFLLMKLIEIFDLKDYDYRWSGDGQNFDMTFVLKELEQLGSAGPLSSEQRSQLLSPLAIEPRFVPFAFSETTRRNALVADFGPNELARDYGNHRWAWNNSLKSIFVNSAVSLISESIDTHLTTWSPEKQATKAASFSEKTLFSVFGLTFPIWVGGYNQANEWKRFGFDIFEDLVDHSYQNYQTVIERCYWAIAKNLHLLQDRDRAQQLRSQHLPRLLANRNRIFNGQYRHSIQNEIFNMPPEIRIHAQTLFDWFEKTKTLPTYYEDIGADRRI